MYRRSHFPAFPSKNSLARAVASVTSPSGTFTIADSARQIVWDANTQGTTIGNVGASGIPALNIADDVEFVLAPALARVASTTVAADTFVEPKFWVQKATLEMIMVNVGQADIDVILYPWVARYDSSSLMALMTGSMAVEEKVGTDTFADETTIGWTPFQSKAITESFILGKPRKIHLQGGQSFRYTVRDLKPLYVNYGRLFNNDANNCGWARRSRGCILTCRGTVMNDDTYASGPIVQFGAGAMNLQLIKRYHWVAPSTPYHFSDVVPSTGEFGTVSIIQPQTGAITASPAVLVPQPP